MKFWIVATLAFGLFFAGCSQRQTPPIQPVESPSASMMPEGSTTPVTPTEQIKPSAEELSN